MELTNDQNRIVEAALDSTIFLSGPAGTGKTTAAVHRLKYLLADGVPGHQILLFFPQRNLSTPYLEWINSPAFPSTSKPISATLGGLARRTISHFWPLIRQNFPAFSGTGSPTFLTLESSLYFMSKIVEPLITEEGFFSSVTIQRNRLYSQILDNLNKSSVHGFPHEEIGERLISSWIGDPSQSAVYQQAQVAANLFRSYSYQHNLLDFSLQVEVFMQSLNRVDLIADYIRGQQTHLIYDNCEEDVPTAHDLIRFLFPGLRSALVLQDEGGGYRSFLGASPENASHLASLCSTRTEFRASFVTPSLLDMLSNTMTSVLEEPNKANRSKLPNIRDAISIQYQTNLPELADWVAKEIEDILDTGCQPKDIVILAPYLSDSTRFILSKSLAELRIPHTSHRPSRALREEPAAKCVLTLAALAHPGWGVAPPASDLAASLYQVIRGLDLPRAYLLARRMLTAPDLLNDFDQFPPDLRERITFYNGNRYQVLIDWIKKYLDAPPQPLDHFIILLFGQVLSQPGYGFHANYDQARVVDQICSSIQKFRDSAGDVLGLTNLALGSEYYRMVNAGILANQHLPSWAVEEENSVFLAPAYTYLLSNRPVEYQFWLDTGSRGWYERIYQPLTNPHVLSREWISGVKWTDQEEQALNLSTLNRLTTGLIRRCKNKIHFCLTETDELGYEQKGILLQSINAIMRSQSESEVADELA